MTLPEYVLEISVLQRNSVALEKLERVFLVSTTNLFQCPGSWVILSALLPSILFHLLGLYPYPLHKAGTGMSSAAEGKVD